MKITGLIIAGGQGRRMGSADKGLTPFRGKPMIAHVIERFAPQVDELIINANRSLEDYAKFGYRVVEDEVGGFAGPLAGLERGLALAQHEWVATAPCDSPFLPLDLLARLREAAEKDNAQLAVAKTFDQAHPVFCLCRRDVHEHLKSFLQSGGRKIDFWYKTLHIVEVSFDEEEEAFNNFNTREEMDEWQ
jgi:molybdopterin-guanine dinucleotide biosynthesis protein A